METRFQLKQAKIRPETRFSCHFFKLASLVFLEITYNDTLQQCRTSSRGKIYKEIFGSLVFLEIAYKDSLQQCITSSRGKTYKKFLGGLNFDQNGPNSGPELVFLEFSQIWFIGLPLNCIG